MQKEFKTLREVCELVGKSRRAIQGYEKLGLVKPSGTNKYGHLLYDSETIKRILLISILQKLKFSLLQIVKIIDLPPDGLKCEVEERIKELKMETEDYLEFLNEAESIISKPLE